jgi:hypothetical protein
LTEEDSGFGARDACVDVAGVSWTNRGDANAMAAAGNGEREEPKTKMLEQSLAKQKRWQAHARENARI